MEQEHSVDNNSTTSSLHYESIPSFNNYSDLTQDKNYVRLPPDWFVIVTDIEGSTDHIEHGRYRDVNTVGAMSIAAVRNVLPQQDFPFVFGGDGASLVVRPDQHESAVTSLLALQRLVQANYNMKLRVGSVKIEDLEVRGVCVEVARYEIAAGMCIAMFRGGGLALADSIVKSNEELGQTELSKKFIPCLDSLSCRWEKIPSRKGCILTILAMNSNVNDSSIYATVLQRIEGILRDDHNPVNTGLAFQSAANLIRDESRMHHSPWNLEFVSRVLEILVCVIVFRWKRMQQCFFDAVTYEEDVRTHTDYRKFDDMIRMVVDCTEEQANSIEELLRDFYENGGYIYYGTHRSSNTIITCMVESTKPGHHIHFADGDHGGYAMAAKTLKKQLNDTLCL